MSAKQRSVNKSAFPSEKALPSSTKNRPLSSKSDSSFSGKGPKKRVTAFKTPLLYLPLIFSSVGILASTFFVFFSPSLAIKATKRLIKDSRESKLWAFLKNVCEKPATRYVFVVNVVVCVVVAGIVANALITPSNNARNQQKISPAWFAFCGVEAVLGAVVFFLAVAL